MQSISAGVLTGESYISVETIFEVQHVPLSNTVLIIILSTHYFS